MTQFRPIAPHTINTKIGGISMADGARRLATFCGLIKVRRGHDARTACVSGGRAGHLETEPTPTLKGSPSRTAALAQTASFAAEVSAGENRRGVPAVCAVQAQHLP